MAEQDAGPNDEERGQPRVPMRTSLARSSSSVSFAFADSMNPSLQRAIEGVYVAFRDVPTPTSVDGCSCCIDQKDIVVRFGERISQIQSADAKIADFDALRPGLHSQSLCDFAAKGVVAKEDVADPCDQDALVM